MTFGQFQLYAEGYRVRESRRWEPFRMVMATQHAAVGNSVTPMALFPLYTDVDNYTIEEIKPAKRPMTTDEVLAWAEIFNNTKWTSS